MAGASKVFETFSLTHAEVLDGTKTFDQVMGSITASGEDWDIYGVSEGKFTPKSQQYENTGDDSILSVWNWVDNGDIAVQAGYMSFGTIAKMTGQTISSSGTGSNQWLSLEFWGEAQQNVQPRPMLLRGLSKDDAGNLRLTDFCVYRVNFAPVTWEGPTYKGGLKINYGGQAVLSNYDEQGNKFADGKKHCLRIVNHPVL